MRAVLLALALLPLGAGACDPDEMDRAMSEICTAATNAAAEAVGAASPLARDDEARAMSSRLGRARDVCINGDPVVAAAEAVQLARLAGQIEARVASKGDKP